jgi:hypothetical protein
VAAERGGGWKAARDVGGAGCTAPLPTLTTGKRREKGTGCSDAKVAEVVFASSSSSRAKASNCETAAAAGGCCGCCAMRQLTQRECLTAVADARCHIAQVAESRTYSSRKETAGCGGEIRGTVWRAGHERAGQQESLLQASTCTLHKPYPPSTLNSRSNTFAPATSQQLHCTTFKFPRPSFRSLTL